MEYYKIIKNYYNLIKFVEFLPNTKDDEVYYFQLFARKKYCNLKIKNGHNCMARFAVKKEHIVDRISRLETMVGSYVVEDQVVPQEALALYVTPNPRSNAMAAKKLIKTLLDRVTEPYNGYKVHSLAYTELHRSCGTKHFVDFDYDFDNPLVKDSSFTDQIFEYVNKDAVEVLKTRGGYHVLVSPSKVEEKYKNSWYQSLSAMGVDQKGDCMLPVPGCVQGDFTPFFLNKD